MADMDTPQTLIFIGIIFQIICSVIMVIVGGIAIRNIIWQLMSGYGLAYASFMLFLAPALVMGIIGFVCVGFWVKWRKEAGVYKMHLIITSIVCLGAGVLGGLLVLIGSAMTPAESVYEGV